MRTEEQFEDMFGLNSCLEHVRYSVENYGEDPIRLLGEYTLRAIQDPLFNKTMINAIKQYIADNQISWNYKR